MLKILLLLLVVTVPKTTVYQAPNTFRQATVTKIYDGDTVTIQVELGDGLGEQVTVTSSARLAGIDAKELHDSGGTADRDYLALLLKNYEEFSTYQTERSVVTVELLGKEKYGRLLIRLWGKDKKGTRIDLNAKMIESGHAVPYDGGAK